MKRVVITSAKRTAVGNFAGSLSQMSAADLGSIVIEDIIHTVNKNDVDEVIMGQVLQAGQGQNPARQASLKAGLPQRCPALTINKVCGSGMKSIQYAFQAITLGDADIIVAGGQENMSLSGHYLPNSRNGMRLGHWQLEDIMLKDGLTCAINDQIHMGITAENLADKYNISRTEQDEFALASQEKAAKAQSDGKFAQEIIPVTIPQKRGDDIIFKDDEFIRHGATIDQIIKPRPAFKKEGSVTAANASGINDGAAALLVMSLDKAQELGLTPLVEIIGFASAGVDPAIMGIGPVDATKKCLNKIGWGINDINLIESNEAFAVQSIAVNKELGWDTAKVNVNGGAIAIGHPIGASGARIVTTLIHEMVRGGHQKGLSTMCIGGGQGIAAAFQLI